MAHQFEEDRVLDGDLADALGAGLARLLGDLGVEQGVEGVSGFIGFCGGGLRWGLSRSRGRLFRR